jgi:hypothetical protein
MEVLAGRSRAFDALLASAAPHLPDPVYADSFRDTLSGRPAGSGGGASRTTTGRGTMLRWAAGFILLATVLSVAPARAWIGRRVEAAWAWLAGGPEPAVESAEPEPGADDRAGGTEVTSAWAGPLLTVTLTGDILPDSVIVRESGNRLARARLWGDDPDGEILVRPDGFDVRVSKVGAFLEVWVPESAVDVRLMADDRELARRPRAATDRWGWVAASEAHDQPEAH